MRTFLCALLLTLSCTTDILYNKDDYYYNTGMVFFENGAYREAATSFLKALECDWSAKKSKCIYQIGDCYRSLAERNDTIFEIASFDTAYHYYNQVALLDEKGLDAFYKKGECRYRKGWINDSLGNVDTARFYYRESKAIGRSILTQWPQSIRSGESALLLGHLARKADSDSAIIWYDRVVESYSDSKAYDNGLYWSGDYYYSYKNTWPLAINRFTQFILYRRSVFDTLDSHFVIAQRKLADLESLYE